MGGFFSLDSPAMVFLSRVADLMLLNLLVMTMCIPIITIGPALTALHYVLLKMARKEEGYLFVPFLKSFKANFKIATLCWLIMLALMMVFYVDMEIINNSGLEFARWLRTALYAVLLIGVMAGIYVFPLIARFENNIRNTFKNALYMAIINLPKTALMIVIYLIPPALALLSLNTLPIVFLLGISVPSYMCAKLYSNIFKRFEPEEEPIDADSWTVNMEE
jgi:uncharacterized membrane protein YesL